MTNASALEASSRAMVEELRANFDTGFTRSYEWRMEQMKGIHMMLQKHYGDIVRALGEDLHKPELESDLCEIAPTTHEVVNTMKHLKEWMRPEAVPTSALLLPAHSEIRREPYGVALLIAPFNYPFQLALIPLLNALAAGNCAVLKPSELTPATSALLARLIPAYVDRRAVRVVEGAIPETTALLAQRWDFIFFTGSEVVGRIVHAAASKHLTPCVLELGGKSPVVVDKSVADIDLAARRIVWGKLTNAGQTCIAPDYVLCHKAVYPRLLSALVKETNAMLGTNHKASTDFCRIVSERHAARLKGMLDEKPGKVVLGGEVDVPTRYVAPTILTDVRRDAKVLQEEIFGPLLPVLEVSDLDEAVKLMKQRPNPLALYVFAHDKAVCERVMDAVPSGGVCLNDTLMHFVANTLPFGGRASSGLGRYHGKFAFDTFSHAKGVLRRDDHSLGDVPLRYAPYTAFKHRAFRALADALQGVPVPTHGHVSLAGLLQLALMALGVLQLVTYAVAASRS